MQNLNIEMTNFEHFFEKKDDLAIPVLSGRGDYSRWRFITVMIIEHNTP